MLPLLYKPPLAPAADVPHIYFGASSKTFVPFTTFLQVPMKECNSSRKTNIIILESSHTLLGVYSKFWFRLGFYQTVSDTMEDGCTLISCIFFSLPKLVFTCPSLMKFLRIKNSFKTQKIHIFQCLGTFMWKCLQEKREFPAWVNSSQHSIENVASFIFIFIASLKYFCPFAQRGLIAATIK